VRRSKYLIDTNLYIAAIRDTQKAEELEEFSSAFSPFLYMSSVVAQELLVGADPSKKARKRIELALIEPFEQMGRLVTPSHRAWKVAGQVVAQISRQINPMGDPVRSSFWNDALIATSCRESGISLITSNSDDFRRIKAVMPFSFTEPWPER
jgi:predicted nucleic acid-binding protein